MPHLGKTHRLRLLVALFGIAFVTACAASGSGSRNAGGFDCASFTVPGSTLATDIASQRLEPECSIVRGPAGGRVERLGMSGKGASGRQGPPQLGDLSMVILYRYYGYDKVLDPIKAGDMSVKNFRYLPDKIPAPIIGAVEPGRIYTFDIVELSVGYACVMANTKNANNSRTRVEVCRVIGMPARDEDARASATKIVKNDLPMIQP